MGLTAHVGSVISAKDSWGASSTWGPNLQEFQKRFDPAMTYGEGPQRLKNLYFTYLVELRALAKVLPYLKEVHIRHSFEDFSFFYTNLLHYIRLYILTVVCSEADVVVVFHVQELFYTGNAVEDEEVRKEVRELLEIIKLVSDGLFITCCTLVNCSLMCYKFISTLYISFTLACFCVFCRSFPSHFDESKLFQGDRQRLKVRIRCNSSSL
jgi:hypothetical protein